MSFETVLTSSANSVRNCNDWHIFHIEFEHLMERLVVISNRFNAANCIMTFSI